MRKYKLTLFSKILIATIIGFCFFLLSGYKSGYKMAATNVVFVGIIIVVFYFVLKSEFFAKLVYDYKTKKLKKDLAVNYSNFLKLQDAIDSLTQLLEKQLLNCELNDEEKEKYVIDYLRRKEILEHSLLVCKNVNSGLRLDLELCKFEYELATL